jgi:nucleoid-associated protein YgaU
MADSLFNKLFGKKQNLSTQVGKTSMDDAKKESGSDNQQATNAWVQGHAAAQAAQTAQTAKVIAQHKVEGDQTLSHLALKYYGHTTPPYWRLIYEFNKAKIGPNHKNIYDGLVLDIPELPADLK